MEAANLGAYMKDHPEKDIDTAIAILSKAPNTAHAEYTNAAIEVLKKFGQTNPHEHRCSLAIPTFLFGSEPFNRFAALHAKFFSNALREDFLLSVSTGGMIYTPGGAGTRQEIFQNEEFTANADDGKSAPEIFFTDFWKKNGLFDVVQALATHEDKDQHKKEGFSTRLYCTSDSDEIVNILNKYRDSQIKNSVSKT